MHSARDADPNRSRQSGGTAGPAPHDPAQAPSSHPGTIPARENTRGPTLKSRTPPDLHVYQISDVVICQRLHVEPELHHIPVLHHILLALHAGLALGPGLGH
ncbi:hypothetical protein GCM10018775_46100 [Streptomyces umbrinus]|nr:hypothetical protein GCM10018775_46100 [Streptomyces umbrinus]